MSQRDSIFVLGAIVLAVAVAAVLLVGSMAGSGADDSSRRVYVNFNGRTAPTIRPIAEVERSVPVPFRPVIPFQRSVSDAARGAAGYLLVLLGVSATLVLGRDQVLAAYHAARGSWREQLRVFATGVAVLALLASAAFLGFVVLVGTLAQGFRETPLGIQFGLQIGLMTAAVVSAVFVLVALVGFAAASWRLGDTLLGAPRLASWGQRVPSALAALIGTTILYLAMQLPAVGWLFGVGVVAYALGTVVVARLTHHTATAVAASE
ncbi:MAG TPA: hypothetical protein VF998_04295 [Candidatus Limnocylindria bacterium]